MRAAFIPGWRKEAQPTDLTQLAAVRRRRDLPKGMREVWSLRQFRSIETAMRFERRMREA